MRAQFLRNIQNFIQLLMTLKRRERRHRAPFLFASILFASHLFLASATPFLVAHAEAQSKQLHALDTPKQQKVDSEKGASGKPLKTQPDAMIDPATYVPNMKEEEILSERTEYRKAKRNKDGTITVTQSNDRLHYKNGEKWEEIDSTLVEDTDVADSGTAGKIFGKIKSGLQGKQASFKVKKNDWQARFTNSLDKKGMLRYQKGDVTVVYRPINANKVDPVIENTDQGQVVTYKNLWNGIDVQYEITNSKIKEFIAIKNKNTAKEVAFKIDGVILEPVPDTPEAFRVVGHPEIVISEVTIALNGIGVISEKVATQKYEDYSIKVQLDGNWVNSLSDDKFPIVIDPTTTGHYAQGLNYTAFKSDGYVCGSNSCYMNAGSLYDNGWKHWRTIFCPNYNDFLQPQLQRRIHWAGLYLNKKNPPPNYWFGVSEGRWFEVSHATSWQFNSINWGLPRTSAWFAQDGWINMTPQMQYFVHNNIGGACFVINGEEVAGNTYKAFIDNALMQYTYSDQTSMTTPILPQDKATIVTDQPTLSVNNSTSPNGDQVRYYFRIATNSDGETGQVINSGDVDTTSWTVPEGMLKDGQTYYWRAYSSRWVNGQLISYTTPNWVRSFKYDARTGSDSTQSFDTSGPISIGLATGNARTSATTHSMSSLGGSIGVGLEYNSPKKSKPGLLGEYFNNPTWSGTPSVSRVDQQVNFNWINGSPSFGSIGNDSFTARWTGYFIAPVTGAYNFGGSNDDGMSVRLTINGTEQLVYNQGCYSGNCFGSAVNLTEGQIVPIRVEFSEGTGTAYAKLLVKGAVAEQIIPSEWLRTPLRDTDPASGLRANYYNDNNNHTVPTDTSQAFVSRVESKPSFNYGAGSAVATGPIDNFLATYDGYITVPSSGTYQFGTVADDAAKVTINNQVVVNDWIHDGSVSNAWGNNITLTGGVSVPIRIEYYEIGGGASFNMYVRGAVVQQEVPANWLSSKTQVLPAGWNLSLDVDGDLSYDYANITSKNVILLDAGGTTHEYTWNGSTFTPPVNEYGVLVRNADGTITLQDADGKTYIFGSDGKLLQATLPVDDRAPAARRFEYTGTPARLSKISDGIDSNRNGTLHYKGDSNCPAGPSGFDANAPDNMLCAFKTTDGDMTKLFYKQGQLARIELPGGEITDIGYDNFGRIIQHRSSLANDVITAGVRTNDASVTSQIEYDVLGRVSKVIEPAPNAGDARREHTYNYSLARKTYWSEPEQIEGELPASGLTATNWGADKLALFARNSTNNAIVKTYQNGIWSDWTNLGGGVYDEPGAASWSDGRIDTFVRGTDNQLYTKVFENGVWMSNWVGLGGGAITSAPSATSWGYQRYDVVAKGAGNDLLHRAWTPGTGWTNFGSLGGCISQSPSVSTSGFDRLHIYVQGCGNPNSFFYQYWQPGWSGFGTHTSEQNISSGIQSYTTPSNNIHIVARGSTGTLRYLNFNGASWNSWQTIQTCIQGMPAIANQGNGDPIVMYKGCDNKLYQTKMTTVTGTTTMRSSNSSEPNGYSERIEYDTTLRTVKDYDKAGNSKWVEYHPIKDFVLSLKTPTGLKSTTIYDQLDLPTESYGPAPASWFSANRKPFSAYASQVPRSDTKFDENIFGLNVTWYDYKNKTLYGAPKLHATGIKSIGSKTAMGRNFANEGVPFTRSSDAQGVGFRATGNVTFPTSGTYTFNFYHADGARLFIDNKQIVNYWNDSASVRTDTGTFIATAGKAYDIRVEYYTLTNTSPGLSIGARLGSNPENGDWSSIGITLKPSYNLQTSARVYDAQLGDSVSTTNYGDKPELGQNTSVTNDPTGLNLTNTATYETYGAINSYLRQTSSTLPGGNTTTYAYYTQTEAISNPCVPESLSVSQSGRLKLTTEQDPDGAGPLTARVKELRYDAKGRIVASRINNDPWLCTSFDNRGRVTRTEQPDIQGRKGRVITNSYAVNGNPLKTSLTDSLLGTSETEVDLLGRTKWSKDIWGNEYTSTYDVNGRLALRTSPVGAESQDYDMLDRPVNYKLDGTVLATMTYDNYSRMLTVTYPEAKDASSNKLQISQFKKDALNRNVGVLYTMADGKTYDESVSLSQSSKITGAAQIYDGQTLSSSFAFDKVGRLTSATVGQTKYDYGYGAPASNCSTISGNNQNAHKNSNRTSYTVTNTASSAIVKSDTYCFDLADRLQSSSDTEVGTPTYDDHGNTISFAGNGQPVLFGYDASDQNVSIEQGNKKITYVKTGSGSIVRKKEYVDGTLTKSYRYVAGGRILQSCNLNDDNSCIALDTYISLPGSIVLTKSPNNPNTQKRTVYSLKNYHGDTVLTLTSEGKTDALSPHSNLLKGYGPFGEDLIPGTLGSTSQTQINAQDETMGWATHPSRKIERTFTINTIQMGARVYIPSLGRFLQVDPVEGGTLNPYVYAHDPINMNDYSGRFVFAIPLIAISASAILEAALGTAVVIGAVYVGTQAYDNYKNNSKSSSQSQSKSIPIPIKPQPYTPTTKPGLSGINPNTASSIANNPNTAAGRGIAFTTAQLHVGFKPVSGRGLPLFAPSGIDSIMNAPLKDKRYALMQKYSYNYFDVPTGQNVEIHYNIDEFAHEYADMKVK